MTWYYAKDGAPVGPISDGELLSKFQSGTLPPETLIWRAGMAEWSPASSQFDLSPTPSTAAASPAGGGAVGSPLNPPVTSSTPPVLPHFFCTCCGTIIPADQLVRIEGRAVCASCKPAFLQQVQEGVSAPVKLPVLDAAGVASANLYSPKPDDTPHAGFWIRALAALVDILLLWAVALGTHLASGQTLTQALGLDGADWTTRDTLLFGLDNLVSTIYETLMVGRYGGTVGKLLCRIRVVKASGERLGYGHAFLRALAQWVSVIPCGLGFVLAAFDQQKRALHDFICNTRVVWVK